MNVERIKQYISKATFAHGADRNAVMQMLDEPIAQVSAAPEQEPAYWMRTIDGVGTDYTMAKALADKWRDKGFDVQPLYTHADPSEVAQLRDAYDCNTAIMHARTRALEAATRRADAAERKLTSVTEYVQGMVNAAGNQPSVATGYLRDILDALLPASSKPAKGGDGETQS